jgi:hypothetical protein
VCIDEMLPYDYTAAQRLSSMLRLLSERFTQKKAGWTKPLCATAYGISNKIAFNDGAALAA